MNAHGSYNRTMLRTVLSLFASADTARAVQARGAFGPTELLDQWPKVYVLTEDDWLTFSLSEQAALRQFDAELRKLIDQVGPREMNIDQLVRLPAWDRVETHAQHALATVTA